MTARIAIVGGGPKGTYGFERLAAQFAAHPPAEPVEIHLFNRTPHFGAGEIYDPGQPDYLWVNYAAGNIDMWIDETPPPVVPRPLPLVAWLREQGEGGVSERDYVSRAQVGRYLSAGFEAIAAHLPPRVTLRRVVGTVVDLWQERARYRLTIEREGQQERLPGGYRHVLLATGHPRNPPTPAYHAFASRHPSAHFVPFIYPVEPRLTSLPPQQPVAIKGIGLTFIDAALALTEGRGGRFERVGDRLTYHPGGHEPSAIFPFSRSGLPMLPRAPHVGGTQGHLRFFTANALAGKRPPYDFVADLWPLLQQEMVWAYYRVRLRLTPDDEVQLGSFDEVEAKIAAFHRTHGGVPFDPSRFLDPLRDQLPRSPEAHHRFVVEYLRRGIASARAGVEEDAHAAVTAVWRQALPLFRELFAFGGLTPASHEEFMSRFAGPLSRVTFGPPADSSEKLLALAEAGIVRFDLSRGAQVGLDEQRGHFQLESDRTAVAAPILVDARIPKISLDHNHSPLYRNLLGHGLAQPFVNADPTHRYATGGLALTPGGLVRDARGHATRIALTGTPTEGVVFDNDSLSRHCNNFVSGWAARCRAELADRGERVRVGEPGPTG